MVTKAQAQVHKSFHFGSCKKSQKPEVWTSRDFSHVKLSGFMLSIGRKTKTSAHYGLLAYLPKVYDNRKLFHPAKSCRVHKKGK